MKEAQSETDIVKQSPHELVRLKRHRPQITDLSHPQLLSREEGDAQERPEKRHILR